MLLHAAEEMFDFVTTTDDSVELAWTLKHEILGKEIVNRN